MREFSQAVANSVVVERLSSTLRYGGGALRNVPEVLKELLAGGAWRDFKPRVGDPVMHTSFVEFLTVPLPAGLGTTYEFVRNVVRDDPEALDMLDQAVRNPAHLHAGDNNVVPKPKGNSRDKALRKLRDDAPELHAEVLAGHLSPHGAMVQAGYRRRTFTIPADDPERLVGSLLRNLTPARFAEVRRLLSEYPAP